MLCASLYWFLSYTLPTGHFLRGSQEERVSILRMALAEKGVHCAAGLTPQEATSLVTQPSDEQPDQATIRPNGTFATPVTEDIPIVDEDGGINL